MFLPCRSVSSSCHRCSRFRVATVLIDAEAGIEQTSRDVLRRVTRVITVLDRSQQSINTARLIRNMVDHVPVTAVVNRGTKQEDARSLPEGLEVLGVHT